LIRIVAYHSLTQRPVDVPLAVTVLDQIHPASRPTKTAPSVGEIQRAVASYFGLDVLELTSAGRSARVTWPRQIAIHLIRELTDVSLHRIGQAFGGRNHTTVLHACKRVAERVAAQDQQAVDDLRELRSIIGRGPHDRAN
jgi:chromosomal replication initiator protein